MYTSLIQHVATASDAAAASQLVESEMSVGLMHGVHIAMERETDHNGAVRCGLVSLTWSLDC